jgi:acylphosphatase
MKDNVRAHVIVSGRVQGVFFRAETRKAASRIGVTGWVRNRPEGTVEAVFEGKSTLVDQALAWCQQGSPMSKVTDVRVNWGEFSGEFENFTITH